MSEEDKKYNCGNENCVNCKEKPPKKVIPWKCRFGLHDEHFDHHGILVEYYKCRHCDKEIIYYYR